MSASNEPLVTICIPTYNRLPLLLEAIESCCQQTCQDWRIVIGDDSSDSDTEVALAGHPLGHRIDYIRNDPALRQARNVQQLISAATGRYLVLLHDDDILMPRALEVLMEPLERDESIVASFGKQYTMTATGELQPATSEKLNAKYYRTAANADRAQQSIWSALVQQFPNDGFMVRTHEAKLVGYRSSENVGDACDADFGFRLSHRGAFFYVGEYTAAYRVSEVSVSSGGLCQALARLYTLIADLEIPSDLESSREKRLAELAPPAVMGFIILGLRRRALAIWCSSRYGWRRRVHFRGIAHLLLCFAPSLAINYLIKQKTRAR